MATKSSSLQSASYYLLLALAAGLLLALELRLWRQDFKVPLDFRNDIAQTIIPVSTMMHEGGWLETRRLSAPFSFPIAALPSNGLLNCLIYRAFSLAFAEPGAVINAAWMLMMLLTATGTAWCLRVLEFDPWAAAVGALLYTWLPYNIISSTRHMFLHPYCIAPVMAYSILLAEPERLQKLPQRRILFGLTAAAGLQYVYLAYFSCFALLAGSVIGWIRARNRKPLLLGGTALFSTIAVFALSNAPGALIWARDRPTRELLDAMKSPGEADVYRLLIRHMVSPVESNPIPALAWIGRSLAESNLPLDSDDLRHGARLGMAGAAGFVVLLLGALGFRQAGNAPLNRLLETGSGLLLSLLMLCVAGGFGSLFNVFVSPQIRVYARGVFFIAWLVIPAAVALVAGWLRPTRYYLPGLALLLALGLVDQYDAGSLVQRRDVDRAIYYDLKDLVRRLERALPSGSSVYQLPAASILATPLMGRLPVEHHLRAYMVSDHLRWSFPALTGESTVWNRFVSAQAAGVICRVLSGAGFAAIWVDRDGYSDDARALASALKEILGPPLAVSNSGKIVVFDLRGFAKNSFQVMAPDTSQQESPWRLAFRYQWGSPIRFEAAAGGLAQIMFLRGLSYPEAEFTWTDGHRASAFFAVAPAQAGVQVELDAEPVSIAEKPFPVEVSIDGCSAGTMWFRGRESRSVRVPARCISGKETFLLEFGLRGAVSPKARGLGSDVRILGLAIRAMSLNPE